MNPDAISPIWTPQLYAFLAFSAGLIGLVCGSFFNVAIYRVPLGLSVNSPRRSFCFRCGGMIGAIDNIPVLSWLFLRGRCRQCGAKFSGRYALVELLTGIIFAAIFCAVNPMSSAHFAVATVWYWAFAGLLIVGTFTDLDHWIIPDGITLGGTAAALVASIVIGATDGSGILTNSGPLPAIRDLDPRDVFSWVEILVTGHAPGAVHSVARWWDSPANALIGAAVGPAILYGIGVIGKLIFRRDAMGLGDVKLFAMIGATLGPVNVFVVLMLASLFGSIGGMATIVWSWFAKHREHVLDRGAVFAAQLEGEEGSLAGRVAALARSGGEKRPRRALHHLPFGPWITLAALLVLIFHRAAQAGLVSVFVPGAAPAGPHLFF